MENIEKLKIGSKVIAKVDKVEDWGILLSYSSFHIFINITELSWFWSGSTPKEFTQKNDTHYVKITSFDPIKNLYGATIKQVHSHLDPWQNIADLSKGKIYSGKVVSITDFGAFVEVLPGLKGLVKGIQNEVKVEQWIVVQVIDIDSKLRRLLLSEK